ncbi:DUF3850 domain-containing protein [Mixta calida]|uniref:DUF3850 domain-containing protein n=1 Tax=Mixta calida TaxID=665913 RepID=UPI002FDCA8E0
MTTHELKIWPEHYEPVKRNLKKAELRKNDRNYQAGDTLVLRCWDSIGEAYMGHSVVRTVTHVTDVNNWLPGFVLLSME